MGSVIEIVRTFGRLGVEIAPYFLVGTLAGAALKSWLPFSVVERYLRPGLRSMLAVSVFGGVVPVCSCSMVPVAQAMKEKGAALGAVVAFLLVAPVLSPVTVFLTWGWLGPKFMFARIIAAFAGALLAGTLMERIGRFPGQTGVSASARETAGVAVSGGVIGKPKEPPDAAVQEDGQKQPSGICSCECKPSAAPGAENGIRKTGLWEARLRLLWTNFVVILKDLWLYLLIGVAASAVISVLVPKDLLPSLVGTGVGAYLLAAGIGVPIYVCSGEEIPIAKALLDINLPAGATFTFLLSSTGICLPTILMASRFLGKRNAAIYAFFWFVISIFAGVVFSLAG